MIILNYIIDILIIMFEIIKLIKPGYLDALENGDLKGLEGYIKRLVEHYKDIPEESRKEFGAAILEILDMENSDSKTAAMLDINDGNNGKIEEAIYSFALESENFDMLQQLIDGLVKAYQETSEEMYDKKAYGIESLKVFNIKNSEEKTAIMLAAKHGLAALLEVWYKVPGKLTKDKYLQEEHNEVYALREASYTTQDNNGHNALMLAVMSGNLKCLRFLLSPETATEILNQKDKNENTALWHAIKSGNNALVKEFLRVVEGTFNGVNKYYPNKKVTLVIDDNMSDFINNIENENIRSLVKAFISESKEHISRISSQSLKRKSTEQGNETLEKKRKEEITEEAVLRSIQKVLDGDDELDGLEKLKDKIGPTRLVKFKKWMDDKLAKYTTELTEDHKNEVYQKLKELEGKLKEVGQLRLTKLLNEAEKEGLTANQKGTIINNIKKIILEADIDLSEDQMHLIPSSIMGEVVEIINTKEKAATI